MLFVLLKKKAELLNSETVIGLPGWYKCVPICLNKVYNYIS